MSKTITCDICGKMYRYSAWKSESRRGTARPIPNRIELKNVNPDTDTGTPINIDFLDVCTDCFNKFSQWVDDQRQKRIEELKREAEATK